MWQLLSNLTLGAGSNTSEWQARFLGVFWVLSVSICVCIGLCRPVLVCAIWRFLVMFASVCACLGMSGDVWGLHQADSIDLATRFLR